MVSTQRILKPKFCRQCTLQKNEPFGNYNRIAPANLSSSTCPCLTVWADKIAGNVGAQRGLNSISAAQRMRTQGLSWLVQSGGWCLEAEVVLGCPWENQSSPFCLHEGARAVVRTCMSPCPTRGPSFRPFSFFRSKQPNLQSFKERSNGEVGEVWSESWVE